MGLDFNAELSFFRNILENMHIKSYILEKEGAEFQKLKKEAFSFLCNDLPYSRLFDGEPETLSDNTVYRMTDGLFGNYIFLRLPCKSLKIFVAGPYVTEDLNRRSLLELCEKHSIAPQISLEIQKYYGSLPLIKDTEMLSALFNTLGERLWGSLDSFTVKTVAELSDERYSYELLRNKNREDYASDTLEIIESRYETENNLIRAVSQGMTHKAEQIIAHSSEMALEARLEDPVRNIKNYTIVLNTLLRKAAEYGSVHPFYIDEVSSAFARKIEKIKSVSEGIKLQKEMTSKYCRVVKKHSMKCYSLLVQKVITAVDSNLASDLSLRRHAELLNVNASYLSALFKKETGVTLTDYVSKKRVEYAVYLLKSTNLQIQTIAQHCGILDVNYFTKTFKKYMNMTPKEYRESL